MCPHCGTREEEWDPTRGGRRHAYYPSAYVCEGCRAIEEAYEADRENAREANVSTHGVRVRLRPNEEAIRVI